MRMLRGKDVTLRLKMADGEARDIVLKPAYLRSTGIVFGMGRVTGLRKDSPATRAKPIGSNAGEGLIVHKPDANASGDKITAVFVKKADGGTVLWSIDPKAELPEGYAGDKVERRTLDPLKLPDELQSWADGVKGKGKVGLSVLRTLDGGTEARLSFEADWDADADRNLVFLMQPNAPMVIQGLGLGYQVDAKVVSVADDSPAKRAGVEPGDLVTEFRDKPADEALAKKAKWQPVKPNQAAFFFYAWLADPNLHSRETPAYEIKVKREKPRDEPIVLTPEDDKTWPGRRSRTAIGPGCSVAEGDGRRRRDFARRQSHGAGGADDLLESVLAGRRPCLAEDDRRPDHDRQHFLRGRPRERLDLPDVSRPD